MGSYCLLRSVFSGVSDPSQVAAGRQHKNQSNFIKVSQHKKKQENGRVGRGAKRTETVTSYYRAKTMATLLLPQSREPALSRPLPVVEI